MSLFSKSKMYENLRGVAINFMRVITMQCCTRSDNSAVAAPARFCGDMMNVLDGKIKCNFEILQTNFQNLNPTNLRPLDQSENG